MQIELITIGDELLLGFTLDTNGPHIARALAAIGVTIVRRSSVGDDAHAIGAAVREALDRTGAVITTGGLGPTADDMTKPAIAAIFGRAMVESVEAREKLDAMWMARFGKKPPVANYQQALIPEGARILDNQHGSAPGIWLEDDRGRWVAMIPGVPREARGMLADTLLPLVEARARVSGSGSAGVVRARTVRTTNVSESALPELLGDLARTVNGMSLAYLPSPHGVDLRIVAHAPTGEAADAILAAGADALRARVGAFAYAEDDADLAALVLERCRERDLHIAVAESCTGGLLGARLTAVPRSSHVVIGGVIAYSNQVKIQKLGVPEPMIAEHGAVSEPVVRAMATGARTSFGAEIGMSISGIAGPGGGTAEKPVGLVWVAVDVNGDVKAYGRQYPGDRDEIRFRATQMALDMVRRALDEAR